MKKITLLMAFVLMLQVGQGLWAQGKKAVIKESRQGITIDGDFSDWRVDDNYYVIDVPLFDEKISMSVSATDYTTTKESLPTWRGFFDNEFIYILVEVPDDDFYPHTESGLASYESDKPEIYFDINEELKDGLGAKDGLGHYGIWPSVSDELEYVEFAYGTYGQDINGASAYGVEYKISLREFSDKNGVSWDYSRSPTIGFDITIIDLDEAGHGGNASKGRYSFCNGGGTDESWNNMDDLAELSFLYGHTDYFPNDTTSIVNIERKISIQLAPNPASNMVTIACETVIEHLEIFDLLGNLIQSTPVYAECTQLNVSDFNEGVYLVKVETVFGRSTESMVISR